MSVKRGDPLAIKASDWNALLGLAGSEKLRQSVQLQSRSTFSGASGVVVPVKNGTGSTVNRYSAMGIGAPLFEHSDNAQTFLNQLAFNGETASSSYLGKFAVAQETIPNGKIGSCLIDGLTVAEITVGDTTHDRVDVDTAGGSKLVSQYYGAGEILYKEPGTGTKWALIRVGSFVAPQRRAVAAANITAGSSGNVTIQPAGQTLTAYLDWMEGSQNVTSGQELLVVFMRNDNKWIIIGAECP